MGGLKFEYHLDDTANFSGTKKLAQTIGMQTGMEIHVRNINRDGNVDILIDIINSKMKQITFHYS